MILRGKGLSMTNRQEDICNRVAFATEITKITNQELKLELAKYYKNSEMTAFISERSRNSK